MTGQVSQILRGAMDEWRNGTRALVTVSSPHKRIHDGVFYSVGYTDMALAQGADLEVLIRVVSGVHVRPSFVSGGDAQASFFEDPLTSDDGTAITPVNRNRFSSNASSLLVFHTPTVTDDGTVLGDGAAPGGSGNNSTGSSTDIFEEWILSPGDYLVRLTNASTKAEVSSLSLNFYEDV